MAYRLFQTDTFIDDVKKLDGKTKRALKRILWRVKEDPTRFKQLVGKPGYFRARLGVYRLVYKLKKKDITLMFIKKRNIVYKKI